MLVSQLLCFSGFLGEAHFSSASSRSNRPTRFTKLFGTCAWLPSNGNSWACKSCEETAIFQVYFVLFLGGLSESYVQSSCTCSTSRIAQNTCLWPPQYLSRVPALTKTGTSRGSCARISLVASNRADGWAVRCCAHGSFRVLLQAQTHTHTQV